MSRVGLGRHGLIEEKAGDPLDGLVNLFDIGMILAVAFLIAGLSLTLNAKSGAVESRGSAAEAGHLLPSKVGEPTAPTASGRGEAVGQVYRLPDGRLIYVRASERQR
jgi:hypothetical protein